MKTKSTLKQPPICPTKGDHLFVLHLHSHLSRFPSPPPGAAPDGRIGLRRRYLKGLAGPGNTEAVQVMAEFQRGVWEGFNVLPLEAAKVVGKREGLLQYRRQP